jgi:hypothetical protein
VRDDAGDTQDHPYLPHYDWSSVPGDDERFELTPEKEAANAQHAADKEAVEGGRTLRLVLGAPIIVWSFVGIPAFALLALVAVLGLVDRSNVDTSSVDAGLVGFFILLALIEVTSIWAGLMLMRDRISVVRWRAVFFLGLVVAVVVTVSLVFSTARSWEWVLAPVAVWYCVAVALWQWRRSARVASAAERLEDYSP